jgi:putative FmdB family regulatory protein
MRVYEYECVACGHRFELVVGFAEHDRLRDQRPPCPECSSHETNQLISSLPLQGGVRRCQRLLTPGDSQLLPGMWRQHVTIWR